MSQRLFKLKRNKSIVMQSFGVFSITVDNFIKCLYSISNTCPMI